MFWFSAKTQALDSDKFSVVLTGFAYHRLIMFPKQVLSRVSNRLKNVFVPLSLLLLSRKSCILDLSVHMYNTIKHAKLIQYTPPPPPILSRLERLLRRLSGLI